MVTPELGACEWFVWDLRRSNLIDRGQLDQIIGEFLNKNPRAEPPALAEYLVGKGILTQFQAERLLAGKTQGFVLGQFTLMDALGAGSMGTVYKAKSKTDNNWYAVKVTPRRSMWNVRIARRKIRSFEQSRHPSVVPFIDVGTAGNMHYLAWPYVEGETLEKVVQERGKLPPEQVAAMGVQIAEGLDICHQNQLIHGLLKPSNIMIGADSRVHILDFGIGCLLAETEGESLVDTMSTANSVASGLDCASPESIMDPTNLTPAGDQYSLGCVLYYALAGQYPFPEGSAAEKMVAHQFKEPTSLAELNPALPPALVAVVQRLLQKSPENRFANAAEVAEALRPLVGRAPAAIAPLPRPQGRPMPPLPRREPRESAAPPASAGPPARPMPAATSPEPSRPPLARPIAPVAPSSPTPKPPPSSLPTRDSLLGNTAAPSPAAHQAEAGTDTRDKAVPGAVLPDEEGDTLEERLGPLGVMITFIVGIVLVWLAALYFRIF